MGWRDHLPVHPAADLFPLMSESELRELGEDIKASGLQSRPILLDGMLIDGRNRLDAMELVGIKINLTGHSDLTGCGLFWKVVGPINPCDFVISANLHRRHLTDEQRRELIAKIIKAKPEASDRTIAAQVKRDHKTVAKVRKKMESTGEVSPVEKRVGADGKKRGRPRKVKPDDPLWEAISRGEVGDACVMPSMERERATASAEISIEQRKRENAALDDGDDIVERALSLIMAMTDQQRAQFFAKYTELSAAKLPPRP